MALTVTHKAWLGQSDREMNEPRDWSSIIESGLVPLSNASGDKSFIAEGSCFCIGWLSERDCCIWRMQIAFSHFWNAHPYPKLFLRRIVIRSRSIEISSRKSTRRSAEPPLRSPRTESPVTIGLGFSHSVGASTIAKGSGTQKTGH